VDTVTLIHTHNTHMHARTHTTCTHTHTHAQCVGALSSVKNYPLSTA